MSWSLFSSLRGRRGRDGYTGATSLIPYSEIEAMYRIKHIPEDLQRYLTSRIELLDSIDVNYQISELNAQHNKAKNKR